MGMHDRDWWKEAQYDPRRFRADRRRVDRPAFRPPTSTARPIVIWLVIGACLFAGFRLAETYRARRIEPPAAATPVAAPMPRPDRMDAAANARATPLPASPMPGPGRSSGPSPSASSAGSTIYRCGNAYGHDACANGRVVDAPAASGFDSRPSAALARLVADGRARSPGDSFTSTTTVSTTTTINAADGFCATSRDELDAIDRAARQPLSMPEQDRLRMQRVRLQGRRAAAHC